MTAGTTRRCGERKVTEARGEHRSVRAARGQRPIAVEAYDGSPQRSSGGQLAVQWFSRMARRLFAAVSIAVSTTVAAWVGMHTPIQTASGEVVLAKHINLETLRDFLNRLQADERPRKAR